MRNYVKSPITTVEIVEFLGKLYSTRTNDYRALKPYLPTGDNPYLEAYSNRLNEEMLMLQEVIYRLERENEF
jgi:hypothetical protein